MIARRTTLVRGLAHCVRLGVEAVTFYAQVRADG